MHAMSYKQTYKMYMHGLCYNPRGRGVGGITVEIAPKPYIVYIVNNPLLPNSIVYYGYLFHLSDICRNVHNMSYTLFIYVQNVYE